MKKSTSGAVLILGLLVLLKIVSLSLETKIDPCTARKFFLEEDIHERVAKKYIQTRKKSFRKDTIIQLESNRVVSLSDPPLFRRLYQLIDTGDLVVKNLHSDTLSVFRDGHLLQIFVPVFDCK